MATSGVSVVISTYNRARFIEESLCSILEQTVSPQQVIVVNDGSTDDTRAILEPFIGRIQYLEQENSGKATALNRAFPLIEGKYVWIFDDDDVALPDTLERHLNILSQEPDIDFTYGTYLWAGTGADGRINPWHDIKTPQIPHEILFIRFMENCFLLTQAMLIRKYCFDQVGQFDTSLIRSQDYEMLLRVARIFKGKMISGPTFMRRHHDSIRGSGQNSFSHTHMFQKWFEYDKYIFSNLRQTLALEEYLPRDAPYDLHKAYLQRMTIMGIKGLWEEMLDDLNVVLQNQEIRKNLSPEECVLCHKAMSADLAITDLLSHRENQRRLKNLRQEYGSTAVFTELGRGLYYTLIKMRKMHGFYRTLTGFRLVGMLVGSESFAILKQKLSSLFNSCFKKSIRQADR